MIIETIPLIGSLFTKIFGDKEQRDQHQANARGAVYGQFANEFGHSRTWWDSLIDGLNRLPRPFMTFGTIYIFWLCWSNPVKFLEGATALQAMPKEGWYILGAVVTFWFAAKLPKSFGKLKKPRVKPIMTTVEDVEWSEKVKKRYSGFND